MKSTTIRFSEPVYRELERASRVVGLPINSIVTVACLAWLRDTLQGRSLAPGPWITAGRTLAAFRARRLGPSLAELTAPAAGDPLGLYTAAAQEALAEARDVAERGRQPWIGTAHLLRGLAAVEEGRACQALRRLDVDVDALAAQEDPERPEPGGGPLAPTMRLRRAVRRAHQVAGEQDAPQVGTDHLLLGLVLEGESRVAVALAGAGVTAERVRQALEGLEPDA